MSAVSFLNSLLNRFEKTDLDRLDGWRGFLAFVVVIAHANQIFILPIIGLDNYVKWGFGVIAHFAVLGFFVISGIAITMSLVLNLVRNKSRLDFREYTIARISRIHPPLIFSILLCIVFYVTMRVFNLLGIYQSFKLDGDLYVVREWFHFSIKDILTTIIFESSSLVKINGPLWSLIIEWWIYFLALVFVGVFYVKSTFKKVLLALIFILIFIKLMKLDGIIYLILWFMGAVYYLFGKKYNTLFNVLLVLSLISLFFVNYYMHFFEKMTDLSTLPIVQILFGLCFLGLILKLPAKTFFNSMAKYSYTIYIIHFPFFIFIFSIFHKSTQGLLGINILLSFLSIIIILFLAAKSAVVFENKKYYAGLLNRWVDKIFQKKAMKFEKITKK